MIFRIKKYLKLACFFSIFLLNLACENRKIEQQQQIHAHKSPLTTTLSIEQIKAVGVEFGSIEQKDLTATIKTNGILRVPNDSKGNVASLYGGVVRELKVQIGDRVKKGQVIATIANPEFIRIQEEYLSLKGKLLMAKQEKERQFKLVEGKAGALKNLQNAIASYNTLKSRETSLIEQLNLIGVQPSLITFDNFSAEVAIKSPLSGVVSEVFAKIGSYVNASTPIAEVIDNTSLHLDLQVFEKDLPLLKVGQIVHFTITNNPLNEYDAKIFSIGSSFENNSKAIAVHCEVVGETEGLIDGMNVTGLISLKNTTSPAVPSTAIVSSEGADCIFVALNDTNKMAIEFQKVEVIKGVSNVGYTAITLVNSAYENKQIAIKGAYFINAKMTNNGGGHAH